MDDTRMTLSLVGERVSRDEASEAADQELDAFSEFLHNELHMGPLIRPERALLKTYIMLKLGVEMTK